MNPCNQIREAALRPKALAVHAGFLLILSMLPALNGCAWLVRPPENDEAALQRISHWAGFNAQLKQFKGLMQVRIQARGNTVSGRAAFAAAVPDRLRLEFLNPIGQPLIRLASDGRTITLISAQDNKIHHFKQNGNALERVAGIPMSIEDFLDVLIGRPPLPKKAAAQIRADSPGCEVVLKSRWHEVLADIRSATCDRMSLMKVYSRNGRLQYTIRWLEWQSVQGYAIPRSIQITSVEDARVDLIIERFWPAASVPPSTFVLTRP